MAALNYAVLMHPNASGHTGYFKPWFGAIILLFYYSFWRRGYPRPPWRPLGPPCAPMTPALFHNLKGTQILYALTYLDIRGAIKKLFFFLLFVKKLSPPPPPPFLTTSVFSDKDFLDWPPPKVSVEKSWRVLTLKFATFHQNGGFGDNSRP